MKVRVEYLLLAATSALGSATACDGRVPRDLARVDLAFIEMPPERWRCQIGGATSGISSVLPPFEARCARAPDKLCRISENPTEAWEYSAPASDPVWVAWKEIGYDYARHGGETYFHRQLSWEPAGKGCRFVLTAFGDFDDDGEYSTYEISQVYTPLPEDAPPTYDAAGERVLYDSLPSWREDERD
jgi:hypothetical protein